MDSEMISSLTLDAELLNLLKALADGNRLRLVGLLAHQELSVEQLAQALGIGMSTTSHHLRRLSEAGLVQARAQGHYSLYRLRPEALSQLTGAIVRQRPTVAAPPHSAPSVKNFLNASGRIRAFPRQQKKFLALLEYALEEFQPGERLPERELNARLSRFSDDTATLRRGLVEHGYMAREGGGGAYWRLERKSAPEQAQTHA